MGLFVPSNFAEINPVSGLFYFSNDHQDLKEGLSSFASESLYYLNLLTELAPNNLIIIDEIFNSTSSEEASSLALALFEEIKKRSNSKILVSTHHQMLKTLMHSRIDYLSAHVGFDFDRNLPTYKLLSGEPGSSLAFKIFDKLSHDYNILNHISEKASQYLDQKQLTYESLLQDLSAKKIELDKLLSQNREYNQELKNQKKSMEGILTKAK
jgi:DNA mismatch repair protein MutS2